jgi:hypothetical protein
MTPKEKAEELINEMFDFTEVTYIDAKKCAIIAVDEILEIFHSPIPNYNYWQEVKQEIEKL